MWMLGPNLTSPLLGADMARLGRCLVWAAAAGFVVQRLLGGEVDAEPGTETLVASAAGGDTPTTPLTTPSATTCSSSTSTCGSTSTSGSSSASWLDSSTPCTTVAASPGCTSTTSTTSSEQWEDWSSESSQWEGWNGAVDYQPNPEPIPDDTATGWNTAPVPGVSQTSWPGNGRDYPPWMDSSTWQHTAGSQQPHHASSSSWEWNSGNGGWQGTAAAWDGGWSQNGWYNTAGGDGGGWVQQGGWDNSATGSGGGGWTQHGGIDDSGWSQHGGWDNSGSGRGGGGWTQPGGWSGTTNNAGWHSGSSSSSWAHMQRPARDPGQWRSGGWQPDRAPPRDGGLDWTGMREAWERRHSRASSSRDTWGGQQHRGDDPRGRSQQPRGRAESRGRAHAQHGSERDAGARPTTSTRPPRERARTVGFWRWGEWQARPRTSSEERAQRGGQGPIRQARRGRLQQQWQEGTFRPAAFYRDVNRDGPEAQEARSRFAQLLNLHQVPRHGEALRHDGVWTARQWGDWEAWVQGPALVVDWSQPGLPEQWWFEDELDDSGFLQVGMSSLSVPYMEDVSNLMQLTEQEEQLLCDLHVPDSLRADLRRVMRTLETHANNDEGPEFRWGVQEFLAAWDRGVQSTEHIIGCLRRRVGHQGAPPYYPVVRTPRQAADRVRALAWGRTLTGVFCPVMEALVDCTMVQYIDAVPVAPGTGGPPRVAVSRAEAAGSDSGASSSSSRSGTMHVRRVRRRVGTADPPRSSTDTEGVTVEAAAVPGPDPGATSVVATEVSAATTTDTVAVVAESTGVAPVPVVGDTDEVDTNVDEDTEGSSLVQRLQPAEAQELGRLGVRRETIGAIGLLLGEMARICEDGAGLGDVQQHDLQWGLRVLDRAMLRAAGVQDTIMAILVRRLRQDNGPCVLPEGEARGGIVQLVHGLLVALSRTYLEDLTNNMVDSWLNPDSLPEDLRAVPPPSGHVHEDVDYGAMSGYGEVVVAPVVEPEDVVAPNAALAASDGLGGETVATVVDESAPATELDVVQEPETGRDVPASSWEESGRDVPASSWEERGRSRTPRRRPNVGAEARSSQAEGESDAVNMVQLLPVLQHEGEQLREVGVDREGCLAINAVLEGFEDAGAAGWGANLVCDILDAQAAQLGALRALFAERGEPVCLPDEGTRLVHTMVCERLFRNVRVWQENTMDTAVQRAVCHPEHLPFHLQLTSDEARQLRALHVDGGCRPSSARTRSRSPPGGAASASVVEGATPAVYDRGSERVGVPALLGCDAVPCQALGGGSGPAVPGRDVLPVQDVPDVGPVAPAGAELDGGPVLPAGAVRWAPGVPGAGLLPGRDVRRVRGVPGPEADGCAALPAPTVCRRPGAPDVRAVLSVPTLESMCPAAETEPGCEPCP